MVGKLDETDEPRNWKVFTEAELAVSGAKSECSEMCKG